MTREQAIKKLISVIPIGRTQNDRYIESLIEVINKPQSTEQQILKKFEELGYEIFHNGSHFILVNDFKKIIIFTVGNGYSYTCCSLTPPTVNAYLTLQEHQLLHELFKCWGWFDEVIDNA